MKLDYATLISPYPINISGIGHIKSPTLREIWNPNITYNGYNLFLSYLLMDVGLYCEKINQQKLVWFNSLPDEEMQQINMFDVISEDSKLQEKYQYLLDFFFVEGVVWDNEHHLFFTYIDKDDDGNAIPFGIIHKDIWNELCDVILQRCGVNRTGIDDINESKVKNKRSLEILKKIKIGRQDNNKNKVRDKDTELPNIISKVSIMAKSINYINIWDLTVFQVYEQFRQECKNTYFNIQTTSAAVWGSKDNKFKGNEWYKN